MKGESSKCRGGDEGGGAGQQEQELASVWPQCSSHLQRWIFSPQKLHALRSVTHAEACAAVKQLRMQRNNHLNASSGEAVATAGGQPEKKKKKKKKKEEEDVAPLPRLKDILQLTEYFALQLLIICRRKNLFRHNVVECACIFFHRFWCRRSPLQYDVRLLLLACLLLALKAEDLARHYTLGDLLGDIEGLDVAAVLRLELPLCEAIDFDVYVLHSRPPLLAIVHSLNALALAAASSSGDSSAAACASGSAAGWWDAAGNGDNAAAAASTSPPALTCGTADAASLKDETVQEQEQKPQHLQQQHQQRRNQAAENDAEWLQSTAAAVAARGTAAGSLLQPLRLLLERSEHECTLMFVAQDLPLLYPPAILAAAAVVAAARSPACSKELAAAAIDVESLLKKVLAVGHAAAHHRTSGGSTSSSDSTSDCTTSGAAGTAGDHVELSHKLSKQEGIVKEEDSESATGSGTTAAAAAADSGAAAASSSPVAPAASSPAMAVAAALPAAAAAASTAAAAGPSGAAAGANRVSQPTEEEEAFWQRVLQPQVEHILRRLQEVKELQQKVQNQQIGEEMELLLDACIEAIEEQQQAVPPPQPPRESNSEAHAAGKRSRGK